MNNFARNIKPFVDIELRMAADAEANRRPATAFAHLETAHVPGQASTAQHVRVHLRMLLWSVRHRKPRELLGQLIRVAGAATKTAAGLVPEGNTGGTDVSPFKRMPIAPELAAVIERARH